MKTSEKIELIFKNRTHTIERFLHFGTSNEDEAILSTLDFRKLTVDEIEDCISGFEDRLNYDAEPTLENIIIVSGQSLIKKAIEKLNVSVSYKFNASIKGVIRNSIPAFVLLPTGEKLFYTSKLSKDEILKMVKTGNPKYKNVKVCVGTQQKIKHFLFVESKTDII